MERQAIEQAAHEVASTYPDVSREDWSTIVDEVMSFATEVARLNELPLAGVEPLFTDLPTRQDGNAR